MDSGPARKSAHPGMTKMSSCPGLSQASTSFDGTRRKKTWMAGTSPAMTTKKFRQRDVYHFHARAIHQRFRMTARNRRRACVWRAGITG
jgi:hypothetical protein